MNMAGAIHFLNLIIPGLPSFQVRKRAHQSTSERGYQRAFVYSSNFTVINIKSNQKSYLQRLVHRICSSYTNVRY